MSQLDEKKMGERLQAARKRAGMTQQMLCQKAGLSYSTLAKIERGAIRSPSIFTIQQIAAALGTGLDELVGAPVAHKREWQRSRSGVRFVYFDVNGCLVHFFHRAFTRLALDSEQTPDIIETAYWHYNDAVCRGEISMAEFNRALGARLKLPDFDWSSYYLEAVEPVLQMHALVEWSAAQYGVGLLTNIMPGLVDRMRERGLIPKVDYDAIVDSSEVHAIKPERAIYEAAQERAGVAPQEILLVDDTRVNLMAAEKCGWHVMWFDEVRPEECVGRIREALTAD